MAFICFPERKQSIPQNTSNQLIKSSWPISRVNSEQKTNVSDIFFDFIVRELLTRPISRQDFITLRCGERFKSYSIN